ncbi:MAG: hypothetical protein K940chlam2_01397, partial [Chlamydiae bacterium]|nr:hypothetical protein [Chlamydiota bacterium]
INVFFFLLSLLFTFTLPYLFGLPFLGEEGAIYRALTFLIAASPCALIIATPTAYLSAISACARRGILLKGGTILDALASCTLTAFDKTGTLTTGSLSCHHIERMHGTTSIEEALAIAAGLEQGAVHPMAEAVLREANEQKITPAPIPDFNAVAGYGLEGTTSSGARALIGHPDFILPHLSQEARAAYEKNRPDSLSSVLLIGEELFCFHYKDELREESLPSLEALRKESKLTIALLTGDHSAATHQVAETLGIEKIFFDLRPEDKLDKVAELSKQGGLIMVGDGVNDAPALARATVGISMGKIGSATAVDASDVVFLRDDLSHLNWLVLKARTTMRVVKENLILALAVILLATTPALLGWVPLWLAVILHEGGTVLVGLNSLRLLR